MRASTPSTPTTPRRLIAAGLAIILALALSGCMRVQRTLQINVDGSGTYTLTLGFREPTPGDPASLSTRITSVMDAYATRIQDAGGSTRRFEDQGYAYWTFMRTFSTVDEGNTLLQETPQQLDPNATPILYHDSLRLTRASGLLGPTFRVSGTISLLDTANTAQDWRDATETLTITMPGGITAHRGGQHDGTSVTYTIHYNESATVDVSGRATPTLPGNYGLAAIFALLSLLLAALAIRLLRSPAKKTA